MQIVVRLIAVVGVFYVALLAFLPAKEGYFALEKMLANRHIYVNETRITDRFGGLDVQQASLFVDGVKVADMEFIRARTALFFSRLSVVNIRVDKQIAEMLPVARIDKVVLTHHIARPKQFRIEALTDKGVFEANGTIGQQRLRFYARSEEKELRLLQGGLKHDEQGWYYEITF